MEVALYGTDSLKTAMADFKSYIAGMLDVSPKQVVEVEPPVPWREGGLMFPVLLLDPGGALEDFFQVHKEHRLYYLTGDGSSSLTVKVGVTSLLVRCSPCDKWLKIVWDDFDYDVDKGEEESSHESGTVPRET